LNTGWTKRALIASMCIVAIGGLALIAKGDYAHLTSDIAKESAPDYSMKNSVIPPTSQSNLSQIAKLFGQVMAKAKEAEPSHSLPETRMNLILKGTFTHEDSDKASALISEVNKDTSRYFIGDELPGAAKLVAVNKGEVTLRRNGQDELLKLPYLKTDERITNNKQRQVFSSKEKNSLTKNSQIKSSQNTSNENTNNSRQQQLKDRLARLRNNNSNK